MRWGGRPARSSRPAVPERRAGDDPLQPHSAAADAPLAKSPRGGAQTSVEEARNKDYRDAHKPGGAALQFHPSAGRGRTSTPRRRLFTARSTS
jgi:hypothetical protein